MSENKKEMQGEIRNRFHKINNDLQTIKVNTAIHMGNKQGERNNASK